MAMPDNIINKKDADGLKKKEAKLVKLRAWSTAEENARVRHEVLWFEMQLYKDGDHYKRFLDRSKSSGGTITVVPIVRRRGEIQRTFNKYRALLRSLKATVTSTKIRYEVPGGSDNEILGSNYLNWFVDKRSHKFNQAIGDMTEYGFQRSVGYLDVFWDSTKAEPRIIARDPFDLLMDRHGKYARRTYTMRKEDFIDLKDSEGVKMFEKTDDLTPTSKLSASDIYDNYLRNKNRTISPKSDDLENVMIEEFHELEQMGPGDKDDEGKDISKELHGKFRIRMTTTTEDSDKINAEETYLDDELRFIAYTPERKPNEIYNEPWMKDALDPQKSLDNIYTHMEEFIRTMGKGRILKRKGGFLDRISDKDGQIVEYEGEKPEFMQPTALTGDQFNFDQKVESMMEDSVGSHPTQARKTETARGIAFLIAQDETNTSEPTDNKKDVLIQVGRRLLKLANRHMVASQDIFWFQDGEKQTAKVIGASDNIPEGVQQIQDIDSLTVDLIPRGAFAALAREEKMLQLAQAGVIQSPEVILSGMNFGNIRELVEKEEAFRDQQAQQQAQLAQQGAQPTQPNEDLANKQALNEAISDLKKEI